MDGRDIAKMLPEWWMLFNYIFVINLNRRDDRLRQVRDEMERQLIPFERVAAVDDKENGARGLHATYKMIFDHLPPDSSVLLFEDDIRFLYDRHVVKSTMKQCIADLLHNKEAWNIFYLGVNTHANFERFVTPQLLEITPAIDGRGTHALGFSPNGVKFMRQALGSEWTGRPVDMAIVEEIQRKRKFCYCCYPLLATQRGGYSDIEKKLDPMTYIVERFHNHTKHLL